MISQIPLCEIETAVSSHERPSCATWSDTGRSSLAIGGQRAASRADLLFASEILCRLRDGLKPSPRMLECSGFVERWMIVARNDDVCLLKGTVWRLPVSRSMLTTPLLAIDPVAGWARAIDEWLTIGPCFDLVHPDSVADRAARWLERQLRVDDCCNDGLRHS